MTAETAGSVLRALSRFGLPAVLVLLVLGFSVAKAETFGTWANLRGILSTEVVVVFLAFAATLPLIVGEFDLSIAAVFTFAQVLMVGLVLQHGWSVPPAILLTLTLVVLVGVVNGVAVARFRINSFIATLASGSIVTGATLAYSKGESIYGSAPEALTSIARDSLAGIPLPVIYAVVVGAVLTVLLTRFPVGRRMYAIGSNERAAERTGIATRRYVLATFVGSAMLAAIGGLLLGARLGAASSDTSAQLLIPAFAGAFLGATAFTPGRFNVLGAATAVYVLAVAVTGLQQVGVALWVEPVFEGAVLFAAVGLSASTVRLQARRARMARLRELERRSTAASTRRAVRDMTPPHAEQPIQPGT